MSPKVDITLEPGQKRLSRPVQDLVKAILVAEDADGQLAVAFVDEAEMARLNSQFRGLDSTTDVLSFRQADSDGEWPDPSGNGLDELGEVVLCTAVVRRYASEDGGDPDTQLGWTILHGVLHLLGYDHEQDEGEMRAREQALLRELDPKVRAVSRALEG